MKRWTLLLFLLLLPFTMAPRTSLTPLEDLEVVLVASQTDVESGDVVNVVGQVRNVGEELIEDPTVTVHIRGDKVEATLVRSGSGCDEPSRDSTSTVTCTVRDLKPKQQATFRFALRLDGGGSAALTTVEFGSAAPQENVTVNVAPPPGDR